MFRAISKVQSCVGNFPTLNTYRYLQLYIQLLIKIVHLVPYSITSYEVCGCLHITYKVSSSPPPLDLLSSLSSASLCRMLFGLKPVIHVLTYIDIKPKRMVDYCVPVQLFLQFILVIMYYIIDVSILRRQPTSFEPSRSPQPHESYNTNTNKINFGTYLSEKYEVTTWSADTDCLWYAPALRLLCGILQILTHLPLFSGSTRIIKTIIF